MSRLKFISYDWGHVIGDCVARASNRAVAILFFVAVLWKELEIDGGTAASSPSNKLLKKSSALASP
jgi:hypothetical protein